MSKITESEAKQSWFERNKSWASYQLEWSSFLNVCPVLQYVKEYFLEAQWYVRGGLHLCCTQRQSAAQTGSLQLLIRMPKTIYTLY